jgi:hypothetical protein
MTPQTKRPRQAREAVAAPGPDRVWFTVAEVAAYSTRGLDEIRAALKGGGLQGVRPGTRGRWTVRRDWIDQWITDGLPRRAAKPRAVRESA